VNPVQFYCKCLPVSVLTDMCKILFRRKMCHHHSVILHDLAVECSQSIAAIADCYNINNLFIYLLLRQMAARHTVIHYTAVKKCTKYVRNYTL